MKGDMPTWLSLERALRSLNCFSFSKSLTAVTRATTATAARMAAPSTHPWSLSPKASSSAMLRSPLITSTMIVKSSKVLPSSSQKDICAHALSCVTSFPRPVVLLLFKAKIA